MQHVFHRHTRSDLPVAVKGDGIYVVDSNGRRYLDASGGAAVSCLGHSHPAVIAAIKQQLDKIAYAHTGFFTNEPLEDLADVLIEKAPAGLDRVYFVSGGSEAVEAGLKLARQYAVERGQPQRRHVIARRQSYHGNTLGALAAGGNEWRRQQFRPLLIETHHIAPCYAYRDQRPDESLEAYGLRVANELEAKIEELGGESVLAFVAEPVVGATAGAVPPVPGYFRRIREICDRHGVLLMLDEVMCGMGRTGTLYACEQDGIVPDLLTVAKGLGGGVPIGALLARQPACVFAHGDQGGTFNGNALVCAVGLAVVHAVLADGFLGRVRATGEHLGERLEALSAQYGLGEVRGVGLLRALELGQPLAAAVVAHAREHLMLGAAGDNTGVLLNAPRPSVLRFMPALNVTPTQVDAMVDGLEASPVALGVGAVANGRAVRIRGG